MDWDLIWDVWYYFINYIVWIFFGLSLLRKYIVVKSMKSSIGKGYRIYPEISKVSGWRKMLSVFLVLIALAMIVVSIFKPASPFYAIPVLIIAGIIYLNGFLIQHLFDYSPFIIFNEHGFKIYPARGKYTLSGLFNWQELRSVNLYSSGNTGRIEILFNSKKGQLNIRAIKETLNKFHEIIKGYFPGAE